MMSTLQPVRPGFPTRMGVFGQALLVGGVRVWIRPVRRTPWP
ncbi:MAG: hypothetical protein VYE68_14160 [Acidobacteriota bacterium]|nr:hypothetical protein [Acidobacteriota bacterium]